MFKFRPIFKTLVWGGDKIAPFKGVETEQEHIGESWELSAVKGDESVIDGGEFDGKTITELAEIRKEWLLGEKVYERTGTEFPLLIKFIDARTDLSVQVHPNDRLAFERERKKGKTEMWYVVGADEGAHLLSGLSKPLTREEYAGKVEDGSIVEALSDHQVAPGDVFFIPAGRIHAICGGCFVAEIQETSDITYRIYDYGRLGLDGKPRQLHTEEAKDAIDFSVRPDYRTHYTHVPNEEKILVKCEHFTTSLYDLTQPVEKDLHNIDSFMVVMCVEGSGSVTCVEEQPRDEIRSFGFLRKSKEAKPDLTETWSIRQGQTYLLPAAAKSLLFTPDGSMKILTSYI